MADELAILQLDDEHIKHLAALEAECFSSPWDEAHFAKALGTPYFSAYGILAQGQLVAYISLNNVAGEMEVLNIATCPEYRRQGLARRLLSKALEMMEENGAEQIFLEVREHNTPAKNLYFSLGFTLCGRRKAYYADSGEDALLLVAGKGGRA